MCRLEFIADNITPFTTAREKYLIKVWFYMAVLATLTVCRSQRQTKFA
jgi:hypothetical protein